MEKVLKNVLKQILNKLSINCLSIDWSINQLFQRYCQHIFIMFINFITLRNPSLFFYMTQTCAFLKYHHLQHLILSNIWCWLSDEYSLSLSLSVSLSLSLSPGLLSTLSWGQSSLINGIDEEMLIADANRVGMTNRPLGPLICRVSI